MSPTLRRSGRTLASLLVPISVWLVIGCAGQDISARAQAPDRETERLEAELAEKKADEAEAKRKKEEQDAEPTWDFSKFRPRDWFAPKPPSGASDTMVLRNGKLVPDTGADSKVAAELASAHELYRREEYKKAENLFNKICENKKNPPAIAEEARFYEAECLRRQERYPNASDTYHKVLIDFPNGGYREQCIQRMFDMANYWLEDTRKEMDLWEEKRQGKRWLVVTPLVHWEKSKPFFDQEGRAIETLERVRYNDMTGPLADKALFLCGSVRFFREDYRDADAYFTQLVELHPNSELAPKAVELGIIAKHLSTGGSDYDGRKVAEARQLINTGLRNYPSLAHQKEKQEFLMRQLVSCNLQQAEKDFKMGEFYRRTGHPGSAYFYYEIVRRRYPGSPYAEQATHKMQEIYAAAEKEKQKVPPVPDGAKPETAPTPRRLPPAGPGPVETAPAPRTVPPGGLPRLPGTGGDNLQ